MALAATDPLGLHFGDRATQNRKKAHVPSQKEVERYASMGLPPDYDSLTPDSAKKARLKALRAWFDPDPDKSHILCTDVDAFVRAHRLWVEGYLKPDPHNGGVYHAPDPKHKYDMVRMAVSEARTPKHPSRAACHAPRGSAKTVTLIREMCSMIPVVRTTRISVLISEMNADRTAEELRAIRGQIENNSHIHRDFGGEGVLFPRGRIGGERWNDNTLCFQHNPSTVMGYSVASKQRGRHPTLGIIDDPEDEILSRNPEWRKQFFRWLFKTYLPMFRGGGKVMWIGTLIHEFSCLQMALKGCKEVQGGDDDIELERDERFESWNRRIWAMIEDDPETGKRESLWPEYVDADDFDQYKKDHGLAAALSEFQGICMGGGEFVFHRDPCQHGYMRCLGEENAASPEEAEDYMLDLRTGQRLGWRAFLDSLYIVGAGDLSDSLQPSADPGALVFIGVSVDGVVYILDAYIRRSYAMALVHKGYDMALQLGAQKIGWEQVAMQSVVVRYAAHYADKLRKEGHVPPVSRGIANNRIDKTRRVIAALSPLVSDCQVRFLQCEDFADGHGGTHRSRPNNHARYHRILKEQVDGYTDDGASGHDDGPDALEMAIRLAGRVRGEGVPVVDETNEEVMRKWAEAGVVWPKHQIPMEHWTPTMLAERWKPEMAGVEEMDPYD